MAYTTLPWSMEQDRQNQIKASSVHVDDNFNTLLNSLNNKIDRDGSVTAIANLPMGGHKITGLSTPTADGDATTKGYVDAGLALKANLASPALTGTPTAPTVATSSNGTNIATTGWVIGFLRDYVYPVGSLYIGTQNNGTCPLAALFGTWQLVSEGRALWGGNGWNATGTIEAGLPNITADWGAGFYNTGASGAVIYNANNNAVTDYGGNFAWNVGRFELSASRSSSIYGNSNTVQPPAYRVNVWRRTA